MIHRDLVVLTVPGYTGSGPGHWQTLWEQENPEFVRVEQADWDQPELNGWVETLHHSVLGADAPVFLVGHSCGAATVVHWASRHGPGPVVAALLVAPADADDPDALEAVRAFAPLPIVELPFPTVLVTSDNDPHLSLERAQELATAWGSHIEVLPGAGHLNTSSGHGPWPEGRRLLTELCHRVSIAPP
jgi:uncharacterized protein